MSNPDIAAIAAGLTIEPWASLTFSGWQLRSASPLPIDFANADLSGLIIADCADHDCLILDDSDKTLSSDDILSAVRAHLLKEKP